MREHLTGRFAVAFEIVAASFGMSAAVAKYTGNERLFIGSLAAACGSILGLGLYIFRAPLAERWRRWSTPIEPVEYRVRSCAPDDAARLYRTLVHAIEGDVPDEGISELHCFSRWLQERTAIFRAVEGLPRRAARKGEFFGFYSVFPLRKDAFDSLCDDLLHHDDIGAAHSIGLDPFGETEPKSLPPIVLLILDFETTERGRRNEAGVYLRADLYVMLCELLRRYPSIEAVSALAATEKGQNLAEKFGFSFRCYYTRAGGPHWKVYWISRQDFASRMTVDTFRRMATRARFARSYSFASRQRRLAAPIAGSR